MPSLANTLYFPSKTEDNNMLVAKHNGHTYLIKEDKPEVGAYLLVFENGVCVRDYLQDNVSICIEFAFEDFGVPSSAWLERTDKRESSTTEFPSDSKFRHSEPPHPLPPAEQ